MNDEQKQNGREVNPKTMIALMKQENTELRYNLLLQKAADEERGQEINQLINSYKQQISGMQEEIDDLTKKLENRQQRRTKSGTKKKTVSKKDDPEVVEGEIIN